MSTALQSFLKNPSTQQNENKKPTISISPTHTQFVQEIIKLMVLSVHEVRVVLHLEHSK